MGIGSRFRARPKLTALFASLILIGIGVAALLGSFLLDQHRAGRFLSQVLTRRLGVPIEVERATTDGASRIILKGIRIAPGGHWSGSVSIREIRVEGWLMPFVAPSGRRLDVVAVSTRVALAPRTTSIELPSPDTLAAARVALLRFLEWPAAVSLEMSGGEIRSEGEALFFDVRSQKASDGQLALSVAFRTEGGATAFTVDAAGAAQGDSLILRVKADGDPRRLGVFWPSAVPPMAKLTAQADLTLPVEPLIQVSGRLTATPPGSGAEPPISADLTATYKAEPRRVDLAGLAVEWGPDVTMVFTGAAHEIGPELSLTLNARGVIDGNRVNGAVIYEGRRKSVRGELEVTSFAVAPLLERFGMAEHYRAIVDLRAERAHFAFDAAVVPARADLTVNGTLSIPGLEGTYGGFAARAGVSGRWSVRLSRGGGGVVLSSVEDTVLTVTNGSGFPMARLTAKTRRGATGPWPLAIEATFDDLSRLPPLPVVTIPLGGSARVEGLLDGRGGTPLFSGVLNAGLERIEMEKGQVVASGLSASVPLLWGGEEEIVGGTLTAESVTAFGFALKRCSASARFRNGVLSLYEMSYTHYGGTGGGWVEADLSGSAGSFRLRFEGEGVDLAALTQEYGLTVGRITGRIRYALGLRYGAADGLEIGGRVTSEPPGGEVGIEPLRTLLSKADADPTGVLRATLENLSVFSYSSLTGEVLTAGKETRLSLSLEGRKRFGIFPARVRAINIQNVPLSLLVKTFSHPRRDSP